MVLLTTKSSSNSKGILNQFNFTVHIYYTPWPWEATGGHRCLSSGHKQQTLQRSPARLCMGKSGAGLKWNLATRFIQRVDKSRRPL